MTYIIRNCYYLKYHGAVKNLDIYNVVLSAIHLNELRGHVMNSQSDRQTQLSSLDQTLFESAESINRYDEEASRTRFKELAQNPSQAIDKELNIVPALLAYLDDCIRLNCCISLKWRTNTSADQSSQQVLQNIHTRTRAFTNKLRGVVIDILSAVGPERAQALVDEGRSFSENGIPSPWASPSQAVQLKQTGDLKNTTDKKWANILARASNKRTAVMPA